MRWLAAAALLPWLAMPLYHPDLYWHLSAGARMLHTGRIAASDWLSFTQAGQPWTDFEWLPELLFAAAYRAFGLAGLWALKAFLLGSLAWLLWRWCAEYGAAPAYRAAAIAASAAASWPRSDLRPEAASVLLLCLLWRQLERRRREGCAPRAAPWATGALFAFWASCHGGFAYGLALLALYAAFDFDLAGCALAAAAGALAQPWGLGVYRVLLAHGRDWARLRSDIIEWSAPRLLDPGCAAFWLLWAAALACLLGAALKRRAPPQAALGLALLALASAAQFRDVAYCAAAAAPLALSLALGCGWLPAEPTGRHRWASALVIAGAAGFLLLQGRSYAAFHTLASARHVPAGAAAFLERERPVLREGERPLRLFNRWGWGGYLGWRLYPAYRVYQDGRYLFHPLIAEVDEAGRSPELWQAFLDRRGVDVAVMENAPLRMRSWRLYPDGSRRAFWRPYYVQFMPRERWALLYWDDQALVFARRSAVDARWLAAREFRYARPGDGDALADARTRREIPESILQAEESRHAAWSPPGLPVVGEPSRP